VCVCVLETMSVGLGWLGLGPPCGGFPESNLLVDGLDSHVAAVFAGIWLPPPPSLSSPVEAEWIWESEEVINLYIGDMAAE